MPIKTKIKRSEAEEKEYYKGLVRKKDKRIKLLEREVARLSKYLMRSDWEEDHEEIEQKPVNTKKKKTWVCVKCGADDYDEITLPQRNLIRKYTTCNGCGNRTRVTIDDKSMATERKQEAD